MLFFAHSIPTLMMGRIIVGCGVGLASLIVPVYLSEISPLRIRGMVVTVNVMMITGGQFFSSLICLALGSNWRVMLGLGIVPSIL